MYSIKSFHIKQLNLERKKEYFKIFDLNFTSFQALFEKKYVYNNGKIYMFIIETKDGKKEFIEYSSYYDCSSIECIKDFENELDSLLVCMNNLLNKK